MVRELRTNENGEKLTLLQWLARFTSKVGVWPQHPMKSQRWTISEPLAPRQRAQPEFKYRIFELVGALNPPRWERDAGAQTLLSSVSELEPEVQSLQLTIGSRGCSGALTVFTFAGECVCMLIFFSSIVWFKCCSDWRPSTSMSSHTAPSGIGSVAPDLDWPVKWKKALNFLPSLGCSAWAFLLLLETPLACF